MRQGSDSFVDDVLPGIRRVCVAVGLDRRQESSETESGPLRRQMSRVITETCSSLGFERFLLHRQSAGDTEIIVLPAGIDEPRTVAELVNGIIGVLGRINTLPSEGTRLRLRMAVHEGITILIEDGFAGRAVTKACCLLGSRPLQAALQRSPGSDFAVILSDPVFEDIGSFDPGLPIGRFERVEIAGAAAGTREVGWILVAQ
jgi:hypothetical protein